MLESIGFRYMEEVDPFDGGPHYRAPKEDISLVKDLSKNYIEIDSNCSTDELFLASINNGHDAFYSFLIRGFKKGDTIKVSHNYNGNLKNKMTVKAFRV
jgi:arginine N-succinyltransferase